jgi:hypothetical protein
MSLFPLLFIGINLSFFSGVSGARSYCHATDFIYHGVGAAAFGFDFEDGG